MTNGPKILTLDIETSPHKTYNFGLFKQNISLPQLIEPSRMLSFASKWHGKKGVTFYSEFHDTHAEMVEKTWELINEADFVVHYNGRTFDMPILNREFVMQGLGPPSPVKQIDLLTEIKGAFRFGSNKLAHTSVQLGLEGKLEHSGFQLWVDCLNGDAKAWALMKRYNKQDVILTEELYDRILPWLRRHPHIGLWTGTRDGCPRCDSTDRQKRGFAYTPLGIFQQYQCNACTSWHRGQKRVDGATTSGVA